MPILPPFEAIALPTVLVVVLLAIVSLPLMAWVRHLFTGH